MESAWALVCTKYLVGRFEDILSCNYSVTGWVTPFSLLSNGDQFEMRLGSMGKMSNNQKPSLW